MTTARLDPTSAPPPSHFRDRCPDCHELTIPRELDPDFAGWFAVYVCCDGVWTKGFDR